MKNIHLITTQKLLFPETVQFSPSEAVTVNQMMPELTNLGFDLSDLGGNTFAVNGIPAGLDGLDPKGFLQFQPLHFVLGDDDFKFLSGHVGGSFFWKEDGGPW